MAANWGLRGKSVVALLLACALALVPAVLLGWLRGSEKKVAHRAR
ncbi:hypothetical protein OPI73_00930 [Pseudomonas aeruginosa]